MPRTVIAGALLAVATALSGSEAHAAEVRASEVTVTVLSSNLASGATVGEWGLSALVQTDAHCASLDKPFTTDRKPPNLNALWRTPT